MSTVVINFNYLYFYLNLYNAYIDVNHKNNNE